MQTSKKSKTNIINKSINKNVTKFWLILSLSSKKCIFDTIDTHFFDFIKI